MSKTNGAVSKVADPVIILVDNKIRDLNVATLIAHHLETQGIACHLEPLEAFRAVVAAYRPGMVVFNHLNASHLAAWSRHLNELGVLTAVLPNEGLVYREEVRPLLSGRFHQARTDYFFCWNEMHAQSVRQEGSEKAGLIEVVGVPRFDFYFEPWSKSLPPAPPRRSSRPRVLFCTNLALSNYANRPSDADRLHGEWAKLIEGEFDYRGAIDSHVRSRRRVLDHLERLIDDGRFEIVLRPHPNEDHAFYRTWLDGLPSARREQILFDPSGSISSLILSCDIQVSCESCTTAIESWIARKPTISLVFDRHPMLYRPGEAAANYECDDPAALPEMIARHLASPEQPEKRELRDGFLHKWCASPDGLVSHRIARTIGDAVRAKQPADWSKLKAGDYRRAAKLKLYNRLGHAYHFDPLLPLKHFLFRDSYSFKFRGYRKSIKPGDVAAARNRLVGTLAASAEAPGGRSRP